MKDKYVEERFPLYFEFAEHEDGRVDITNINWTVTATVSREHARALIDDRNLVVSQLCGMAQAFEAADDEAFTEFWYGKQEKNDVD